MLSAHCIIKEVNGRRFNLRFLLSEAFFRIFNLSSLCIRLFRNLLQSQSKHLRVTYLHLPMWGLVHLPPCTWEYHHHMDLLCSMGLLCPLMMFHFLEVQHIIIIMEVDFLEVAHIGLYIYLRRLLIQVDQLCEAVCPFFILLGFTDVSSSLFLVLPNMMLHFDIFWYCPYCWFSSLLYFHLVGAVYGMQPIMDHQYGLSFPMSPSMVSFHGHLHGFTYHIYDNGMILR